MTLRQAKTQRTPWLVPALLLCSLMIVAGCDFTKDETGKLKRKGQTSQGATQSDQAPKTSSIASMSPTQNQTLAIGQQAIVNLNSDLISAGLTTEQAQVITASAEVELSNRTGTLAVPATALTGAAASEADEPVFVSMPAVIAGALAALDEPGAGLAGSDERAVYAKVILASVFASLNGNIDLQTADSLGRLSSSMVADAMASLSKAGLREGDAIEGTRAITEGATSSLRKAGILAADLEAVSRAVVASAVVNMATADWGNDSAQSSLLISEAIGKATQGAISSLGTLGLNDDQSAILAGQLSAETIATVQSLQQKLSGVTLHMSNTVKTTTKGAVVGLHQNQLSNAKLGVALGQITSASVEVLESMGFDRLTLPSAAAAVAIGSLSGVAAHGLSDAELSGSGAFRDALAGTVKSLSTVTLSELERANAAGVIVAETVAAFAHFGFKSEAGRKASIEDSVGGSLGALKQAGLKDASLLGLAVQNVARGATQSLSAAGFSAADIESTSAHVTKSMIHEVAEAGLNTNAAEFTSMAASVTQGMAEGFASLQRQGSMTDSAVSASVSGVISSAVGAVNDLKGNVTIMLVANDMASVASDLSRRAFTGIASGGFASSSLTTMTTAVSNQVDAQLRSIGVAENLISTTITELSSEAAKAQTLASALDQADVSFPACNEQYSDSMNNDAYFAALDGVADPVFCRTADKAACPKDRSSVLMDSQWMLRAGEVASASTPYLCQLQRHAKQAIVVASFDFVSPPASFASAEPSFTWSTGSGAVSYQLQVATDAACQNVVWRSRVEGTTAQTSMLANNTYYACLLATSLTGNTTKASSWPLPFQVVMPGPALVGQGISLDLGAAATKNTTVSLSLSATGASQMYITNTADCASGGLWESYATTKTGWTLAQADATATVYAKFMGPSGSISACTSDSIVHDTVDPSGSVTIVGNLLATANATLSLPASSDASQVYITNNPDCESAGTWFPYAASRPWTLSPTNGTSRVYVKFKDAAGNLSPCASDHTVLDTAAPMAPASVVDGDFASSDGKFAPAMTWSPATDLTSGLAYYMVAIGTTPGGDDTYAWISTDSSVNTSTTLQIADYFAPATTYYASVKACDNAGNCSAATSGDGFTYGLRLTAFIKPGNADVGDQFGETVTFNETGDLLAVNAVYEDSNQTSITNGPLSSSDNSKTSAGAVYIYKRSADDWAQESYIKPSVPDGMFGHRLAFSGNTLAVSVPNSWSNQSTISYGTDASTNASLTQSGAVYLFERTVSGGVASWDQSAYFKAANRDATDFFGISVALDDNSLAVSAWKEDSNQSTITNGAGASADNSLSDAGAAYVYVKNAAIWSQQAYIKPPNPQSNALFGGEVTIKGDLLVVTAQKEGGNQTTITNGTTASIDTSLSNSGAVYVFARTGGTWSQQAYIKPGNAAAGAQFGVGLDLDGQTLAVSSYEEASNQTTITNGPTSSTNTSATGSGAIYLYKQTGVSWAQEAYLKASNTATGSHLGMKIDLDGDTLVAASTREISTLTTISYGSPTLAQTMPGGISHNFSGAAYVFARRTTGWVQSAFIKAPNSAEGLNFGSGVSTANDYIAVGALGDDSDSVTITNSAARPTTETPKATSGAVYIYKK